MTRWMICLLIVAAATVFLVNVDDTSAQTMQNRTWAGTYNTQDWNRFYHYPYVYYPQNFWGQSYYRSSNDLYYRYPPEMRIPVYNTNNYNYYPSTRMYHQGSHFMVDVF